MAVAETTPLSACPACVAAPSAEAIAGARAERASGIVLSLPIGVATSIYLEEMAPKNKWTDLIEANIHSDDATLLWLPERGILLAGDTVEDTVTFADTPEDFAERAPELAWILDALAPLAEKRVLDLGCGLGHWRKALTGLLPRDLKLIGGLVEDVCYRNAAGYFHFGLAAEGDAKRGAKQAKKR